MLQRHIAVSKLGLETDASAKIHTMAIRPIEDNKQLRSRHMDITRDQSLCTNTFRNYLNTCNVKTCYECILAVGARFSAEIPLKKG